MHHRQLSLNLDGPDYSVRRSKRAKYLQLSVTAMGRVEVILPQNVSERHVPDFVSQHREWIRERLQRLEKQDIDRSLPQQIEFPAVSEHWRVHYVAQARKWRVLLDNGQRQLFCRQEANTEKMMVHLSGWLSDYAKQRLLPMIRQLSRETGLDYAGATIRAQKTRWGSCSSKKMINLNRALLFVTPAQLRYLMLHELCHTRYMNHGVHFWQLLARWEPDYKTLDSSLNRASRGVPYWALPRSVR